MFTHAREYSIMEQMPTRGYQSCVTARLHFGLGNAAVADSVKVVWPLGKVSRSKKYKSKPVDRNSRRNFKNRKILKSAHLQKYFHLSSLLSAMNILNTDPMTFSVSLS